MHSYAVNVEARCSSEALATTWQTERTCHCKYLVLCNFKCHRSLGLSVLDKTALLRKILGLREVLAGGIERE